MGDLSATDRSELVRVTGSDASGSEQTPVQSTANGAIHTSLRNASGAEIGTSGDPVRIDPTGTTTQPVSVGTLPLPTGASTSALQVTGNSSLASIDNKIVTSNLPQNSSATGILVRQVPNEPATFVASAINIDLANNKVMLGLMNQVGSGVVLRMREVYLINTRTASTSGVFADFRLRRITALSGGTAVSSFPYDTEDVLNGSVITSQNSTGTDAAGPVDLQRAFWSSEEWAVKSATVESDDHSLQTLLPLYDAKTDTKPITIRPGEGIVLRNTTNTNNGTFDTVFVFTQETA